MRVIVFGLVLGSIYALSAVALTIVYRATSILNFAQGAIGMFGTFSFASFAHMGVARPLAAVIGVLVSMALGGLLALLTSRLALKPLAATVFTLGALGFLQALGQVIFGGHPTGVLHLFPLAATQILGAYVGVDELLVTVITIGICIGVIVVTLRTRAGLLARAVASRPELVATLGFDERPTVIGSWVFASGLAGLAGILLLTALPAPDTASYTLIVIQSFAGALIGRLVSLPGALIGGLGMGILSVFADQVTNTPGAGYAAMFLAMIVLLVAYPPRPVRGAVARA